MVLARGHGLLTKQAYLSTISLLKSVEFSCCLFARENIKWPTAANWIIVGYIVVVNRCLIEPGCLTKKTSGIGCLSHIQTYTHQRRCYVPLFNFRKTKLVLYYDRLCSGLKLIFLKLNWTVEALNFAPLNHSLATSSAISSLLCHNISWYDFFILVISLSLIL